MAIRRLVVAVVVMGIIFGFFVALASAVGRTHEVKRGENLSRIAKEYHVSVGEILALEENGFLMADPRARAMSVKHNRPPENFIFAGQVVVIPDALQVSASKRVEVVEEAPAEAEIAPRKIEKINTQQDAPARSGLMGAEYAALRPTQDGEAPPSKALPQKGSSQEVPSIKSPLKANIALASQPVARSDKSGNLIESPNTIVLVILALFAALGIIGFPILCFYNWRLQRSKSRLEQNLADKNVELCYAKKEIKQATVAFNSIRALYAGTPRPTVQIKRHSNLISTSQPKSE